MVSYTDILGLSFGRWTTPAILDHIEGSIHKGNRITIAYLNVHVVNQALKFPRLRLALDETDVVYADGAGIIMAAKLLGYRPGHRITGADWVWDLCYWAEQRKHRILFLGATPQVNANAIEKLRRVYPNLDIHGMHGYFDKLRGSPENDERIRLINEIAPDLVIVGFGTPFQEYWVADVRPSLNASVVWCAGAVLDFVAEHVPRAPRWMRDNGLEWLFRLWIEPVRLWRRYLVGNPVFMARVLWAALRKRVGGLRHA